MRAKEFITEAPKQLGRAFNHLEDLVFFYGSAGTIEALEHLKDMNSAEGSNSVRMKWDGNPQIYWGRINGAFIPPHGHAQWSKGVLPATGKDVADYIMRTGKASTPEEIKNRQAFANQFASLAAMFEAATPAALDGKDTFFVYADALFLNKPALTDGVYDFCPNPKSETCYHVSADSDLGKRITGADVMVVGHAYFTEHGQPDSAQIPIKDFSKFNANSKLIVLGPIYNVAPVKVDNTRIDQVENYIKQHATQVDTFLAGGAGIADLKNVIYTYVNQSAKAKQLDAVSTEHFTQWMASGKVSTGKMTKIVELSKQQNNALDAIFKTVRAIQILKDTVIDQIESGPKAEIWDTKGEGRVRYAGDNKQFGNVKFVPRKRWTPA
tara:strand:- start:759 stop:1901 length:1143 start_codon:yes stop_codon:yes gene_type:complete